MMTDAILDALPAHIAVLDPHGRITRVNKAWRAFAALNGLEPAKVGIGCNYLAVCEAVKGEYGPSGEASAQDIRAVLRGQTGRFTCEYPCHSPREKRWFVMEVTPVTLDGVVHAVVMHNDVTERRRLEESLRLVVEGTAAKTGDNFLGALVQHLAQALDTRYALVCECVDPAKKLARVVAAWDGNQPGPAFDYDMRGRPCENILQKEVCHFPENVQRHFPKDSILVKMNAVGFLAVPIVGSSGEVIGMLAAIDIKPLRSGDHALDLLRIFAARAGAEMERQISANALRESEEQRLRILDMSDDAIIGINEDQLIVVFSRGAESTFGYSAPEIIGQRLECLLPERYRGGHRALVEAFGASRVPSRPMGYRGLVAALHKDGHEFSAESSISQFTHGGKLYFSAIVRDVTNRLGAERKLKESEEKLRAVIENAPTYMLIVDCNGRIEFINRSESPSLTREQIVGENLLEFLMPEFRAPVRDALSRVFKLRERVDLKVSAQRPDKSIRWFAVRVGPISQTGDVESAIWIATDITDQQVLEEQLRQSQKMETVGRLAGGVAHDFNNLLTAIMGHAELIAKKPRDAGELDHAKQILDASRRAADLTHQLLAFSRKQVLQPKRINLNSVVTNAAKLLSRLIGENIALKTICAGDLEDILADPSQIDQVLMNLVVNARDAMPKGGSLTIETNNIELTPEYAASHLGVAAGPHVQLSVSDSGAGMSAQVQSRLYEPFFTTKPQGKGTGLGLATVHGIVKQTGGHIFVYSEPGRGTSFKLYFPVHKGAPEAHRRPSATIPDSRGTERILLVEDDSAIRELTRDVLAERGYEVIATGSPADALDLCKDPHPPYDLLLTDVVLPGIGGRALAEDMQRRHPKLKVLFMSGYTDDAIVHHGVLEKGMNFLQKPFSIAQLAAKVREVLDGNTA